MKALAPQKWSYGNYRLRRAIGYSLNRIPYSMRVVGLVRSITTHLINIHQAHHETVRLASTLDGDNPQNFDSGFGYHSECQEVEVAEHYRQQLVSSDIDQQKTESGAVYREICRLVSDALTSDAAARRVLNFGVSYGHVDNVLAETFPEVQFIGIDRSPLTKLYNERFFHRPNLRFEAGDVYDHLTTDVLMHTRTLTCLPQSFVETFYRACADRGVRHICGVEQCGISWQTGKPFDFSLEKRDSVVMRNIMFIHNYPGILRECGYRVREAELVKTNHPDPNFRILAFSATLDT